MEKRSFLKIVVVILLFVIFQTYFQDNGNFKLMVAKWTGYFVPLIWAIFIAILLNPVIEYLEKKLKTGRLVSLGISIILIFLVFVGILFMIIPQIISSIKELNDIYPYIVERTTDISKRVIAYLAEKNIFSFNGINIANETSEFIKNNFSNIQKFIFSVLQNVVWWTLGAMNFLMGLFLAILILLDKDSQVRTRDNIITIIFGLKNKDYVVNKINEANAIFKNYIAGKIIVSFVVGISVFIILFLTKTPYASLSAVLLGVGNMIPYVGSIVGGAVATFLIFIVAPVKVIFLFIAIGVSQLLDGFVIGPKIIGDKVGLNTFWVMLSMLIFGGLFGLMGMFLGVPIMCIIKLFYTDLLEKANKKGE